MAFQPKLNEGGDTRDLRVHTDTNRVRIRATTRAKWGDWKPLKTIPEIKYKFVAKPHIDYTKNISTFIRNAHELADGDKKLYVRYLRGWTKNNEEYLDADAQRAIAMEMIGLNRGGDWFRAVKKYDMEKLYDVYIEKF